MTKTAVITGAGSGVGRAIAVQLAREGWRLGLVGRRSAPLEETAAMTGLASRDVVVASCDIGDSSAVDAMGKRVFAGLGEVEVLVNAAGTNAPNRSLEVLSLADYHTMINT